MGINAGNARHIDDFLRQNLAIGHHHDDVRGIGSQLLHSFSIPHLFRLEHRDTELTGHHLDAGRGQFHVPPYGTIRLGNQRDYLPRCGQGLKGGGGDIPGCHHHDSHGD